MTFRRVIQWAVFLALCIALGLGGLAWQAWEQKDQFIEATLREKVPELLPGWNVSFGRARFDWYRRLRIEDVELRAGDPAEPLVSVPEIIVSIDRAAFAESQQVIVQKLKLVSPVIDIVREPSGKWNWQGLPPLKGQGTSAPEWEVVGGTVRARYRPTDGKPTDLTLHHVDARLIPSGRRAYVVKGSTQIEKAGLLNVDGRFDLDAKSWCVDGKVREIQTAGELLALAAGASPELRTNLVRIERTLQKFKTLVETAEVDDDAPPVAHASGPVRPAMIQPVLLEPEAVGPSESLDRPTLAVGEDEYVPDFGVAGTLDVAFHLSQPEPGVTPDFRLNAQMRNGKITNDVLPFVLSDLEGDFAWDNRQLDLRRLSARNGATRITLGGRIERVEGSAPGKFAVKVEELPLDERLRSRLTPGIRRLYDSLRPSGTIDAQCSVVYDGTSKWKAQDFVLSGKNGSISHVRFPYQVTDAVGTVIQKGNELELLFEGRAGRRPVVLEGVVRNPGPEQEVILDIFARQVPLDETLLAACPAPVQAPIRTLNLRGLGDAEVRLHRPPGPNQKMQLAIAGTVSRGTFEYVHFPYRLTNLTGKVTYSSAEELWTFRDLSAEHGTARITGSGSFIRKSPPGQLDLALEARNAPFDQSLNLALPENLRKLWDDISPQGTIRSLSTVIRWQPGTKADITLPTIQVDHGSMLLRQFPYSMDGIESEMAWKEGRLDIESFTARHDDTEFRAKGFIETQPEGDWRLRLTQVSADDLIPDRHFRKALPPSLKSVVDTIDPQGPISAAGMMEMRGTGDERDPITAAWDIESVLTGATVNAGVTVKNAHGRITSRGSWDGAIADFGGRFDLDSIIVLDHQLTQVKGPYRLRDTQLIVGSPEALIPDRRPRDARVVPADERVTARAIGGVITLDASATFNEVPVYDAKLTLNQGRLEEYAARYLSGAHNIRGTMTGWVDLHGRGTSPQNLTGRGKLQISPAALYELPVLVQVFRSLTFTPPDRAAFNYAYADFLIERQQFQFNTIDLVGDAISLRGHGTAGFNGRLDLDFYSIMPKNRLANIPVVNLVVGEATRGWVGVDVQGQISNPQARVKAVPQFDEATKRFLGAFDPRQAAPLPLLPIPGLTGY